MNKETLHELRSKTNIPLVEALALLKQYDENVEQCIQVYHNENIRKICDQTGCDRNVVWEYYHDTSYKFNVEKVIEKVLGYVHRPIKLVIEGNSSHIDKVGFFIWAEDENLNSIQNNMNRTYFIPRYDFEHVVDIFSSVFPIFNPMRKYLETSFDITSDNYFDQNAIKEVIYKVKALHYEDGEIMKFLAKLIYCLEEKAEIGTYIIVFGNQ